MVNAGSFAALAKANPSRYYRRPGQVVRDRRLTATEKLAILEAWELEARDMAVEEERPVGEPTLLDEIVQARLELGNQIDGNGARTAMRYGPGRTGTAGA
jgi:hypothetical protein